jgi:nitrogen fixation/metabolism regulation signal transduction histidine kinase
MGALQALLAEDQVRTRALLAQPAGVRRTELAEEIRLGLASALDLIAAIERERQSELGLKRRQAHDVTSHARQRIVLVMGVTIFAMIALSLLAPPRVVIPLRRIEAAIRDVENCKFEASIQLRGSSELTAIAVALNRMIARLKTFDELKVEQIRLENARFETLANLVGMAILVCKADGRVLVLNNAFYAMFDFASGEVLNHPVQQTPLPAELIDLVSRSLDDGRRLTREAFFFVRPSDLESERTLLVSSGLVRDSKGELRYGVFAIEERSRHTEKAEKADKSEKA